MTLQEYFQKCSKDGILNLELANELTGLNLKTKKEFRKWLANEFGYKSEKVIDSYFLRWKRGVLRVGNVDLVKVSETIKNGVVSSEKFSIRNETPPINGMQLVKVTQNAYGGSWVTYENKDLGFITDEFIESLSNKLKSNVEPVKIKQTTTNPSFINLFTSDKHIGANVGKYSIYKNEYNPKVYKKRLFKVLANAIEQKKIYGKFKECNYFDLGDALDGYDGKTTRRGHELPQNLDNREQFDTYVNIEREFWEALVQNEIANNYRFIAASNNNHGGSFDYTAYRAVECFINIKYPDIETNISSKFIDNINIGGYDYIFTHGKDEKDNKRGLPLNLDTTTENYLKQYIDSKGLQNVTVVKGDLHQFGVDPKCKFFNYINIPSLFGCSEWIMNNYGYSKAGFAYQINNNTPQVYWF